MASLFPSATRQASLVLPASGHCQWMMVVYICFLLLAGGNSAHSPKSCGKEEFVVYDHEDDVPPGVTSVIAASPSGNGTMEFGTIEVLDNVLRKGYANDSMQVGRIRGPVTLEKDLTFSVSLTLELTAPCMGSLATQGILDQEGNGEVVITGGTGAYPFVGGYAEVVSDSQVPVNAINAIFKFTIHLKYF